MKFSDDDWFSSHDELQQDSSIFTIVHINQTIIQTIKQEHVKQRGTTVVGYLAIGYLLG